MFSAETVETTFDGITSFFSGLVRTTAAVVTAPVQLLSQVLRRERRYERSISPPTYDTNVQIFQPCLTFKIDFITVTACFPSSSGAPGGPDKDDVIALMRIFVSVGCLVATGPLLSAFEITAFAITEYDLSTKTAKMVQRFLDGDNVFEFTTENVTEWLDLMSTSAGFSNTYISKAIVPAMRDGSGKTVLVFLANVLKHEGMYCKTASYAVKVMLGDYEKKLQGMSKIQRTIELAAVTVHFIKLAKLYDE